MRKVINKSVGRDATTSTYPNALKEQSACLFISQN